MKVANTAWVEIAQALKEAREMYGSDSDSYKMVLKETKFSKSTANKLIAIASSKRLVIYQEKLSAVTSWATLYAIHALSDEKFESLKDTYKLDDPKKIPPFITLNNVTSLLKSKTESSPYKVFARIEIDEDALRGDLIDGAHLASLEEILIKIETCFPYVKLIRSGLDEKVNSEFFNKVNNKKEILSRKLFHDAINGRLNKRKKAKTEKQEEYETLMLGMSRAELHSMFSNDPKDAFDYLGYEYDEQRLYDQAIADVNAWASKIGQKVHKRSPNPFESANNKLLAA